MLLRHMKSAWPRGVEDHERPLAKRGLRAGMAMGNYMARNSLMPDLAVVSTARRAWETWDLVRPAFPEQVPGLDERRIYEAPSGAILDVIRETAAETRTLLLVGHNPGLRDLALYLTGTADAGDLARLRKKYPTGGLAVIDFDIGSWKKLGAGSGRLERFVTPKSAAVAA
jgi:phosphohistidine phosphatase